MSARVVTAAAGVGGSWILCISYVVLAHIHGDVEPLPEGIRGVVLSLLIASTAVLAVAASAGWLRKSFDEARTAEVPYPRRDRWEPPPTPGPCRNTPPAEADLRVRVVWPPVDDSPTLDLPVVRLPAGPVSLHPRVLEAGMRIARELRRNV